MALDSSPRSARSLGGRAWPAVLLLVVAALCVGLNGWAFDHWVVDPTRHCHRQGAVPPLAFAAAGAALLLTAGGWAALIAGVRGGRRGADGSRSRGLGIGIAVLLGVLLGLLLAVDVLSLVGDLSPATYDPFNCGGM